MYDFEMYKEDYIKYAIWICIVMLLFHYFKLNNKYIFSYLIIVCLIVTDQIYKVKYKQNQLIEIKQLQNNKYISSWLNDISIFKQYNPLLFEELLQILNNYYLKLDNINNILEVYDSFVLTIPLELLELFYFKKQELILILNTKNLN